MSSYISGQQRPGVLTQAQDRQQQLKAGQIIHGKMMKALGNQQMEVQVGGRLLTAVVSGTFAEGEAKWFQVESAGNPIVLKPVKTDGTGKADLQQLLQSIGLSGNKEMKALLSSLISRQVPVSAEKLTQAAALLAGTPDKTEGISVIKLMMTRDLPLKESVFMPLLSANKGIAEPLSGLLNQVKSDLSVQASPKTSQIMTSIEEPLTKVMHDHTVQRMFEKMSAGPQASANQALTGLKDMQILPGQATLNNWMVPGESAQMMKGLEHIIKVLQGLPSTQVNQNELHQLQQTLKNAQQSAGSQLQNAQPQTAQVPQQSAQSQPNQLQGPQQQLAEAIIKGQSLILQIKPQSSLQSLQLLSLPPANANQPLSFLSTSKEVQSQLGTQTGSNAIQMVLKEVMQRLGTDYEARLSNPSSPPESAAQTLKAQLVSLLNMPGLTAQTKDSAEQVLNRLNGMQLMSAENGPQQQLMMQFPIQLGETRSDVTMKMNGRRKSDGTLDPDHVRVLFYITLSELKESVIDMNVQNRVVSLDIYNDSEHLNRVAEPFIPALKAALEGTGYAFSSVKFHSTKEVDPPIINPAEDALSSAYHKVDVKI
ncbi:hypothetical protein KP77_18280 [Jeotgalibacillus alimentarius]|uniref:Flagellar hook-length control protein-like C-terminal domain-containing protein n=1 Tax=Jeotgalibacillus alimentarius TaxID=135826 RepID=A0A0C2W2Z8_9BACL|nr:hypothetical protein [Jeotgalibacillus alimentarius]KIL50453.1 hypothetical protein KP77_18280 [Jeotgalibacillus alimentarius]